MSPDDRSARVLAENAGFEIVEAGERVWFFHRRTWGPAIAASVSGGVAVIGLLNSVLITTSLLTGGGLAASWIAAAIVVAVALLASFICWASLKLRRRRLERPRAEQRPLAMIDRTTGMLLDGDGAIIAPIAQVRAGRGVLIGSSAPGVFLRPPGARRIEVCRASLGGGGIDRAIEVLAQLGFAR